MKKKLNFRGASSAASSLIAILVGLLAGFVILLIPTPPMLLKACWLS